MVTSGYNIERRLAHHRRRSASVKMPRRACDPCSYRKVKCDGDPPNRPCTKCIQANYECTIDRDLRKGGPRKPSQKTTEAIKRMQEKNAQVLGKPAPVSEVPRSHTRYGTEDDTTDPESCDDTGSRTFQGVHRRTRSGTFSHGTECYCLEASGVTTKIPVQVLRQYLQIYHERLYAVWPVVKWQALLAELESNPGEPEIYALATSLAAAVMGQLQLKETTVFYEVSGMTHSMVVSTDHFAAEALRARRTFEWRDRANVRGLLTSLFFHVYYENRGNKSSSSLALREAVTFVQTMELHLESTYATLPPDEADQKRRLFWLLFVTEKGHFAVHKLPSVLSSKGIKPLNPDINKEPVLAGFVNLVKLFVNFDREVIEAWLDGSDYKDTQDPQQRKPNDGGLDEAQLRRLQDGLSGVYPHKEHTNDVQKADILVTKHWMRSLTWRVALRSCRLPQAESQEKESMSLSFPLKIAEDLLTTVSKISRKAIESHGPGMQSKLLEIADSLADVMGIVPNVYEMQTSTYLNTATSWRLSPVDFLIGMIKMADFRAATQPTQFLLTIQKASDLVFPTDPSNYRYPKMCELVKQEYPPWTNHDDPPLDSPNLSFTTSNVGGIIGEDIDEDSLDTIIPLDAATLPPPLHNVTSGINSLVLTQAYPIYPPSAISISETSLETPIISDDQMDYITGSSSSYASSMTPPGTTLNSPHGSPPVDLFPGMGVMAPTYFPAVFGTEDPSLGNLGTVPPIGSQWMTSTVGSSGLEEAILTGPGGVTAVWNNPAYAQALSHHGSDSETSERLVHV